jgi:hypothetical protein
MSRRTYRRNPGPQWPCLPPRFVARSYCIIAPWALGGAPMGAASEEMVILTPRSTLSAHVRRLYGDVPVQFVLLEEHQYGTRAQESWFRWREMARGTDGPPSLDMLGMSYLAGKRRAADLVVHMVAPSYGSGRLAVHHDRAFSFSLGETVRRHVEAGSLPVCVTEGEWASSRASDFLDASVLPVLRDCMTEEASVRAMSHALSAALFVEPSLARRLGHGSTRLGFPPLTLAIEAAL